MNVHLSRKNFYWLAAAAIVCGAAAAGRFYWLNLRGVGPAVLPAPAPIAEVQTGNSGPLKLPAGFSLSVFAKDLSGARVLAFDRDGNLWVSQTSQGIVSRLELKDGVVASSKIVFSGLKNPHGLAFDPADPSKLYVAEETRISAADIAKGGGLEKIADLPKGGRHFTRSLAFGADGRLYVSIGSTCDVCREADERNGSVMVMNKDGSGARLFARGLRNAVFITTRPADGKLWATEMGRDLLGDDIPPDEIDIIEDGKNYGWPICYGQNIHDTSFDKNTYIRNPCLAPFETPSYADIPAHSAPLGLGFAPASWPPEYRGDLFVAYHGSWNRSVPTGYKVVRSRLDADGRVLGFEDFITGWLTPEGKSLGRPVDIVFGPDGALYISDDKAGVVYRVAPSK